MAEPEATKTRDTEIIRYLPHAFLATMWVLAVPIAAVTTLANVLEPAPSRFTSALIGVGFSILATIAGTAMWIRRPGSGVVSFGDLMLWGWLRRYRAERKLIEASAVLGFDRKGRPLGNVNLSVSEQLGILHELNDALEHKDPYTHGHSRRVERYCFRMGTHLGLPQTELDDLRLAAALHDVGKVAVPDEILRKPGKLEADEKAVMNLHPVVGERMVVDIGNPDIVKAIRHHHEAYAGGSYPDGVAGSEIPLFSRIIAVADSYDAMTSTRPYRAGMPRKKAVAIVTEESGRQFDPKVVDAFLAQHSVPLPIPAAIAQLFELPRNLLANMAVWAKQMGASALASAAGATGMSVVVAAALVAPPAGDPPPNNASSEVAVVQPAGEADHVTRSTAADPSDKRGALASREDADPRVTVASASSATAARKDRVLGIRMDRQPSAPKAKNKPNTPGKKGNPPGTGGTPPVDPPPVEPPGNPPPVEPPGNPPPGNPPPVDPPGKVPPVDLPGKLPPVDLPGNGPPLPPLDGGGGMPPPGPPLTTPPHVPGTDPQPDRGRECSADSPGGPGAPHCRS